MGIVTSFIPGRIRPRHRMFRDDDIAGALIALFKASGIVTGVERNPETGSILITYIADVIPSADVLAKRFAIYIPELARLKFRIMYYTPEDKSCILSAIKKAELALPEMRKVISGHE